MLSVLKQRSRVLKHFFSDLRYRKILLSRLFDPSHYVKIYQDIAETGVDPLAHYLAFGKKEGRRPNPLFDPEYYRRHNQGIPEAEDDPFWHYLTTGIAEDRMPCAWFDPEFYRSVYADVDRSNLSPLAHYLNIGINEGRYPVARAESLPQQPLISIVVPVYDVEEHLLNKCISSVRYQIYPHWELCLADDCSTRQYIRPALKKWSAIDKRIKTIFLDANQGIAGATNAAAAIATGDFIAFLDNDDELTPDCIYEVVREICDTGAELIYTDEDLIDEGGKQFSVFYKPAFNRELLLCHNYVTHFVAVARKLFAKVGGVAQDYDGAQDYDLVLRLSEITTQISHIPKVLYHWRASATSTSINHRQKEYANEAGRRAVMAAMARNSIAGEVEFTNWNFFYRCKRKLSAKPLISVIVAWQDGRKSPVQYLKTLLAQTGYADVEYLVILRKNKSFADDIHKFKLDRRIFLVEMEQGAGKATSLNYAAAKTNGEHIIFLGGQVMPSAEDWIEPLLAYSQDEKIGAVGGRLQPVNNQDEVNLTVPDITNNSPVYYADFLQGCSAHMNSLQCPQYILSAAPGLCMIGRQLFASLNGFDGANFPRLFFGHDLCLRLHKKGFRNIYTPECLAEFIEKPYAVFLGFDKQGLQLELEIFQASWRDLLARGDPYWNIGLLRENGIPVEQFFRWYVGSTAAQG